MCENEFLNALKGVIDPEVKRKIIGDLFISIQERKTKELGLPDNYFLAQGTLRTDIIESSTDDKTRLVKSHHNVGSPLVQAKRSMGKIIEPLEKLIKEDVRSLGRILGLDNDILMRHPFPGPGLAVRILGEVTKESCDILREADAIFIEELKRRNVPGKLINNKPVSLYDDIWQAFAVLLPSRSTGLGPEGRKYRQVLALRAITGSDGINAAVYPFEMRDLQEISAHLTNSVREIGRVCYDISGKPPATIEWE
jgi:GMP synthase (glutamine-hydrolysing)